MDVRLELVSGEIADVVIKHIKETCADIVTDYKMGYVLAYIQGIAADEENDEIFCERMVQNYLNDPDPEKDKCYTLEECKKEWGIE